MRIVWLKIGGLWPLNTGGRLRTFHTVKELSRRHEITLLTTHGPGDDPDGLRGALPDCERVISVPHAMPKRGSVGFALAVARSWLSPLPADLLKNRVPALQAEAERLTARGQTDLAIVDFLAAAPNASWDGSTPTVLFQHNVEHVIWKRLSEGSRGWRRALLEVEWRKMRRYERRACTRANLTVAVSEVDRARLADLAPGANICAIPTGVDTDYFAPTRLPEKPASLVFTGSMDWYPNEDAVLYFLDAILPAVLREIPETSLAVVGRNPTARLRSVSSKAPVSVTGTVEDVRPYIQEAAVYVVPLRIGGGTRLKIFEALAMAKPVVSTRVGAEGLPLEPGKHFALADEPEDFAREIVSLLRDSQRRRTLGAAGRSLVEDRFSWPRVAGEFESRCREVVDHHAR